MGRHSAPDDTDEDVELDGAAASGGAVATVTAEQSDAAESTGRHASRRGDAPRPAPAAPEPGVPGESSSDDAPRGEGLSLLDHAFGPEPAGIDAADAPTTEIALADLARADRPLPEETTVKIAPVTEAPTAGPPTTADPPTTAAPTRSGHATAADLALIRSHSDVRARVIAAAIAPFVVFVAVFAVRGKLDVHSLLWIWIPAIVAGVLVGALLDVGHKRHAKTAPPGNRG